MLANRPDGSADTSVIRSLSFGLNKTKEKNPTSLFLILLVFSSLLVACGPVASPPPTPEAESRGEFLIEQQRLLGEREAGTAVVEEAVQPAGKGPQSQSGQLPVRFSRPSFVVSGGDGLGGERMSLMDIPGVPVGSDITSTSGPVALHEIMRRLASLKNMNVSWASDVNQNALVDVDIKAEDDFFEAIDNLLRQVDYFHELRGRTIVVKYREIRTFHLAMPFISSKYSTGVGGDVLGAGSIGNTNTLVGNVQITSDDNNFNVWENISRNLDKLLDIWEETVHTPAPVNQDGSPQEQQTTTVRRNMQSAKGFYTIDKPVGLITVNAPRPLVEKIEVYINNLKKQLFRQISIEAKIIEVSLDDRSQAGLNWSGILSSKHLDFQVFGPNGVVFSTNKDERTSVIPKITIGPSPFRLIMDAIETQGDTNILANPRISVMNGQPALISVGDTFRYISEVSTTVNDSTTTASVVTDTVMSGLGMAVLPNITDDDQIVLSLTPVTSQVTSPIEERTFEGLTVQLPQINIRELKSMVMVRSGDVLMIGGLIDSVENIESTKVPVLGELPGLGRLFRHNKKSKTKKELIILLKPTIL